MTSLKLFNRRVGSLFGVAALVLATVTPGLVPAFASAAQISERSVTLSSSSRGATGVTYQIQFTPESTAGAAVFQFCSNTPLINTTCTAPGGFSLENATAGGSFTEAATTADEDSVNAIVATGSISAAQTTITLSGVANPSAAGPLYVRILTYADQTAAQTYTATSVASAIDQGSAAVSITDTVGVSGAVLESMTFCVAGNQITDVNCERTDEEPLDAPVLELGETVGSVTALDAGEVSEGTIYSQISTNAVSGAVVHLKSSTTNCGGLARAGATDPEECHIAPATAGITAGNALFGVKVAAGDDPDEGNSSAGAFGAANSGAYYSPSVFKLNFVTGNGTGVTSVFGDPFLDTSGAPANNKNINITFGASAANNTPAGLYSADLSLIATGKF